MKTHLDRVFQIEHAGDMGGGHFTDTMADDAIRRDSPGTPECDQPDLQGETERLGHLRECHPRIMFTDGKFVEQRPARMNAEDLIDPLDCRSKHRLFPQQLASHSPPLRPHARKNECETGPAALRSDDPGSCARNRRPVGKGTKFLSKFAQ